MRTRRCSARTASYRDPRVYGHAVQAASRQIFNRLAPDHGYVQPFPFPAAAIRRERGKQLSEAEWFYDVVVRTELETDDAIDLVRTMAGHDDDRNIRMRTNFPQEIQPIILRSTDNVRAQVSGGRASCCSIKGKVQGEHQGERHDPSENPKTSGRGSSCHSHPSGRPRLRAARASGRVELHAGRC